MQPTMLRQGHLTDRSYMRSTRPYQNKPAVDQGLMPTTFTDSLLQQSLPITEKPQSLVG